MTGRIAFLCASALASAVAAVAAEPVIRFEADQIQVSEVTPGGDVVYFGVAKERHGLDTQRVVRMAMLADEDHDGAITIPMPDGIPCVSTWVAVDLRTGLVGASAASGAELRHSAIIHAPLLGESEPDVVALNMPQHRPLNLFIARPEVGAWQGYVGDGAQYDNVGTSNGVILADLAAMEPLQPVMGALSTLHDRDIVVAVDSHTMQVAIAVVGQDQ